MPDIEIGEECRALIALEFELNLRVCALNHLYEELRQLRDWVRRAETKVVQANNGTPFRELRGE